MKFKGRRLWNKSLGFSVCQGKPLDLCVSRKLGERQRQQGEVPSAPQCCSVPLPLWGLPREGRVSKQPGAPSAAQGAGVWWPSVPGVVGQEEGEPQSRVSDPSLWSPLTFL